MNGIGEWNMVLFLRLMSLDIWALPSQFLVWSFPHCTLRSTFYAIQSVGPRYGCLHPLTSLKLYYAYSYSILRFGLEVLLLTESELLRCQLSILRGILGLPSRANSLAIHFLLNTMQKLIFCFRQASECAPRSHC